MRIGLWRVREVASPRDVEDGAPTAAEQPACSLVQSAPDLRVQAMPLPRLHRDMTRESVKQPDVAVSVVGDLPVEVAHQDWFEQSAGVDVLAVLRQLTRPGVRRALGQAFADLVVNLLQVGEEPVPALRKDVRGTPERQVASRPEQLPRAPVANRWIEPVPGGGREHQIERLMLARDRYPRTCSGRPRPLGS